MFAVQEEFQQIIARIARVKSSLYCFIEDFFNGDLDLKNLPTELIEALKELP